jgi:hypothetical protein
VAASRVEGLADLVWSQRDDHAVLVPADAHRAAGSRKTASLALCVGLELSEANDIR